MKTVTIIVALTYCLMTQASAQQTMYYRNKQKAVEGKWTFSRDGEVQMASIIAKKEKQHYDIYDDPETNFYTPAQSGILYEGLATTWYTNGNMATQATYHQGIPTGKYEHWSYYGNKEVTGTFIDGKPDGQWIFYYPNGKVIMRVNYKGSVASKHVYPHIQNGAYQPPDKQEVLNGFVNSGFGNPLRWIGYRNTPDGMVKVYNENGDMDMQLNFNTGMRIGTWLYMQDGREIGKILYDNDIITAFYDRNGHNIVNDSALLANRGICELFYYDRRKAPDDLKKPVSDTELPYRDEQQPPTYPGGDSAMKAYIATHLVFPEEDRKVKKEGNVAVEILVATNGHLKDIKITNGLGYGCDEEAIRLVKSMPDWIPARQNGIAIPAYRTIVIPFELREKK